MFGEIVVIKPAQKTAGTTFVVSPMDTVINVTMVSMDLTVLLPVAIV